MEKANHTPGPWEVFPDNKTGFYAVGTKSTDYSGTEYAIVADNADTIENARLIAAAPTMASRIQGALDSLSQNKVFPADIENAKRLLIDALEIAGIEALPLDRAANANAKAKGE